MEIKKPSPRDGAALSRRCRAIQQLSAELNPANRNSPSRCHWAIATCIVLRIQSGFLDDGMLDSLITLRLTFALTKLHFPTHLRSNHVATVQHVLGPEQPSALSELRTVHPRIVKAGIMSLARVRVPPSDIILQRFHDDLTECFPLFLAGIDFALGGFRRLYRSILTMPEDAFLAVFDSNTPVAQCLVAHWLALSLLVNAFVIGMSVEGHRTAVGKGPAWIAMLSSDLGTSDLWSASFRWPINLMRSIDLLDQERSGSDGPTTSAQLLAKILQRPETFAAG